MRYLLVILFLQLAAGKYIFNNEEPSEKFPKVKNKLISNIIEEQDVAENLVFIAQLEDRIKIHNVMSDLSNEYTSMWLDYDHVDEVMMNRLMDYQTDDVRPLIYLVIVPENETKETNETLTLIKTTKDADAWAKIIVVYDKRDEIEQLYLEEQIYDTYIFVPHPEIVDQYSMYQVCRFCIYPGIDELQTTNTWSYKRGFQKSNFLLKPSFDGNFNGAIIVMGVSPDYIWKIGQKENGEPIYVGAYYWDMLVVEQYMNAKFHFMAATDGQNHRAFGAHGLVGGFKDLMDGTIDILGGVWLAGYGTHYFSTFSAPYTQYEGENIISIAPLKGIQWYACIQPFSGYIWALIIISIPLYGVVLYILRRCSDEPDRPASLFDATWDITVILCWDGITCAKYPPASVCQLLSIYMMMTTILVVAYMGSLVAILTKPTYMAAPIDSIDQLYDTEHKIMSFGGLVGRYKMLFPEFADADRVVHFTPRPELRERPWVHILYDIYENPDKYVMVFGRSSVEKDILRLFLKDGDHPFYFSETSYGLVILTWFFRKHDYKKEWIDRALLTLPSSGLQRRNLDIWFMPQAIKAMINQETSAKTIKLISLKQFTGGFLILLIGVVAGLLAFGYEMLWGKCFPRNKTDLRQDSRRIIGGTLD